MYLYTHHKREAILARCSVEFLVLSPSVAFNILPLYQPTDVLAGQWLACLGVVETRCSEREHILFPATLLSVPNLQLSLQLGKNLALKQFLHTFQSNTVFTVCVILGYVWSEWLLLPIYNSQPLVTGCGHEPGSYSYWLSYTGWAMVAITFSIMFFFCSSVNVVLEVLTLE